MAQVIWSNPGNPPKSVADRLHMDRRMFGKRLHKIKGAAKLSGPTVLLYAMMERS